MKVGIGSCCATIAGKILQFVLAVMFDKTKEEA